MNRRTKNEIVVTAHWTDDSPFEAGTFDKVLVCFVFPPHVCPNGTPCPFRTRDIGLVLDYMTCVLIKNAAVPTT